MKMKGCELCDGVARMYCESDQAFLCFSCDENVHSANFLVAKHCRNLLCQVCQSPTPWKASGHKLGPTVSICQPCFSSHINQNNIIHNHDDHVDHYHDDGDENEDEFDSDDGDGDDDDDEDGDNQVVPWSVTSPLPPSASSSSSEEGEQQEEVSSGCGPLLKRVRSNSSYHDSDDEIGCSSSQVGSDASNLLRPLKQHRREMEDDGDGDGQRESRSTAVIDSLNRLQSEIVTNREKASATIVGICRLSREHHGR